MIPTVGAHVQVGNLHPIFAKRLARFLDDPRFGGLLKVFSGVRTYAQQQQLYAGWVAGVPGYNLAADPDRPITPAYDVVDGRGSWHMEQRAKDGKSYGYAVDLNFASFCWTYFGLDPGSAANRRKVSDYIEQIATEHRLARTVPSEEWHYQAAYDGFDQEEDVLNDDDKQWIKATITAAVNAHDTAQDTDRRRMFGAGSVNRRLLEAAVGADLPDNADSLTDEQLVEIVRKGARTGAVITALQQIKEHLGLEVGD